MKLYSILSVSNLEVHPCRISSLKLLFVCLPPFADGEFRRAAGFSAQVGRAFLCGVCMLSPISVSSRCSSFPLRTHQKRVSIQSMMKIWMWCPLLLRGRGWLRCREPISPDIMRQRCGRTGNRRLHWSTTSYHF